MHTKYYTPLLLCLSLAACSHHKAPEKATTSVPTPGKTTKVLIIPEKKTKTSACSSLHEMKAGEAAIDAKARTSTAINMVNAEARLIANELYPQVAASGAYPARPTTSVKSNIENQCRTFSSRIEKDQAWLGATASCLYPKCVTEATEKLKAKLKR